MELMAKWRSEKVVGRMDDEEGGRDEGGGRGVPMIAIPGCKDDRGEPEEEGTKDVRRKK